MNVSPISKCAGRRHGLQGSHCQPISIPSGEALTVFEVGALSDLDDVAVRIADVAANLAVLGYRLRDELGSSAFP